MKIKKIITLTLTTLIGISAGMAFDPETLKVMPFVNDEKHCASCHTTDEIKRLYSNPAASCNKYCLECHKKINSKNHHSIKVKLTAEKDFSFTLDKLGKIRCITCHNLHIKRFDSVSWKSQSLFDKMFKKKNQYRTFFLVIKNDKGQLCRTCH